MQNFSINVEDLGNKNKNSKKKKDQDNTTGEKVKLKRNRKKNDRWSDMENNLLKAAVVEFGERNWKLIAKRVGTRNADQCNQHWHRVINPKITKKKWSTEEDELLLKRTQVYGESAWKKVAEEIVGRTDTQCRHRFKMLLKKKNGQTGQKRKRRTKAEIVRDNLLKNNTSIPLEEIQKILSEVKKANKLKKKRKVEKKEEIINVQPNIIDILNPNNFLESNFNFQIPVPISIPIISNIDQVQTQGLFVQGTNIFEKIYTPTREKQDEMINNSLFDDFEVSNSSTGSDTISIEKQENKEVKEDEIETNKNILYSCENLNLNQLNEICEQGESNTEIFPDININQYFAENDAISMLQNNCLNFENLICDEKFE